MRRLEFDQYEFPDPSGEEHLVVTLEAKSRGNDPSRFLSKCDDGLELAKQFAMADMSPFVGSFGSQTVGDHLCTFASVSHEEASRATHCRFDFGTDEHVVFLDTPFRYVLYRWSTSA